MDAEKSGSEKSGSEKSKSEDIVTEKVEPREVKAERVVRVPNGDKIHFSLDKHVARNVGVLVLCVVLALSLAFLLKGPISGFVVGAFSQGEVFNWTVTAEGTEKWEGVNKEVIMLKEKNGERSFSVGDDADVFYAVFDGNLWRNVGMKRVSAGTDVDIKMRFFSDSGMGEVSVLVGDELVYSDLGEMKGVKAEYWSVKELSEVRSVSESGADKVKRDDVVDLGEISLSLEAENEDAKVEGIEFSASCDNPNVAVWLEEGHLFARVNVSEEE